MPRIGDDVGNCVVRFEYVLAKWYFNGTLAGMIYPPAWETIGLAWDGTCLWCVEKTCELWYDGKVFRSRSLMTSD